MSVVRIGLDYSVVWMWNWSFEFLTRLVGRLFRFASFVSLLDSLPSCMPVRLPVHLPVCLFRGCCICMWACTPGIFVLARVQMAGFA